MNTELATQNVDPKLFTVAGGTIRVAPKNENAGPEPERPVFSYIGFYGDKTKGDTLRALMAAGIEQDQFYLADKAGPTRVSPFQVHILMTATFLTQQDGDGKLTDIIHDVPRYSKDDEPDLWDGKYRRAMLGLAAVKVGRGVLVPATFSVRNAMLAGFNKVLDVIKLASDDERWSSRGDAQKAATEQKIWPVFRVLATMWGESGDYYESAAQVQCTPKDDFAAIQKLCGPDYKAKLEPTTAQFLTRVNRWKQYADLDDEKKLKTPLPF